MLRHLILDWSGTLVDDLPAVWRASNHCFEQAGVAPLSLTQFRAEFALPYGPFYQQRVPHVPLPELERCFQAKMRGLRDQVTELPHARDFLKWAQRRGITMHLLSAIHPDDYAAQIQQNRFDRHFQSVHLRAVDKLGVIGQLIAEQKLAPEATLYVGDMEHDIAAARRGGVRVAAVLTGYNHREQLTAASPDYLCAHLGELREVLEAEGLRPPRSRNSATRYPIPTVGALIFNDTGELLLVRTHKWPNRWGIPGGKIEWGEASEAALRRELREETGLEVTDVQLTLVQDAIHPPEFLRDAHFILLNYTCRAAGAQTVRLNDEAEAFVWISPKSARELPLNQPTRVLLEHWLGTGTGLTSLSPARR